MKAARAIEPSTTVTQRLVEALFERSEVGLKQKRVHLY
jgi:hypothetical protein